MRKLVGLVLLLGLVTGCARPRPVAEAEGEVTFDGQPVTSGIISFVPADAPGRPGGGAVLAGKYRVYPEVGLAPGKYRVEIRWARPTGEKKKDVGYGQSPDVYAEALPEKYHAESVLTAELEEGKNTVHFRLEK